MTLALSAHVLSQLWPHALPGMIDGVARTSETALAKFGIKTPRELIDFMAQCSEETGGMKRVVESGAYTADRAHQVWPSLFPTVESAKLFVLSERALFNKTYGGRLGNHPATNDGYNFRGRGMIQITGRDWYDKIGRATGLDLIGNPDLVASPEHILECAAAYWALADVNQFADRNDFEGEVRRVNGGLTNMAARLEWRATCVKILAPSAVTAVEQQGAKPVTDTTAAPATVNTSPAIAATPARVVPTSTQATRIPWTDWLEQFAAHEEPIAVSAAQFGIKLGTDAIPVIGPMIYASLGPMVAKDAVDAAIKLMDGVLDSMKGTADTITSSNVILTTAANIINSTAPTFAAKAGGLIDGWLKEAVAALGTAQ